MIKCSLRLRNSVRQGKTSHAFSNIFRVRVVVYTSRNTVLFFTLISKLFSLLLIDLCIIKVKEFCMTRNLCRPRLSPSWHSSREKITAFSSFPHPNCQHFLLVGVSAWLIVGVPLSSSNVVMGRWGHPRAGQLAASALLILWVLPASLWRGANS